MIFGRFKSSKQKQYWEEIVNYDDSHPGVPAGPLHGFKNAGRKDAVEAAYRLGLLSQETAPELAQKAFLFAIESGHPEYSVQSSFSYAYMLWGQGAHDAAIAYYLRVVDSKHPSLAPTAANECADRLVLSEQFELVPGLYKFAISHGDFYIASHASVEMEKLREQGKV